MWNRNARASGLCLPC